MIWSSVGSTISLGCQWVITVLIVRMSAGYDAAGVYSLAMAVYGIFNPVAQYRLYTYQVSDVKREYSTGEYLSFRLISSAVALLLIIGYSLVTCQINAVPAIVLFSLYKLAGLLIDVFHGADQLSHRMDYIGISLALQGILSLVLFIFVYGATANLELTLFAMTIGTLLICFAYDYPKTSQFGPVKVEFSFEKAKKLAIKCAPVVIAGILCSAAPSLPRQYLSSTSGSAALGAYASVAAPVAIIQMGVSYIYNPLLSYYSEAYVNGKKGTFLRLVLITLAGAVLVGVVCAVALEIVGGPLLALVYGESILAYLYLLQPLILLAVLTGLMWFVNDLLISLRDFRSTFGGAMAAFLVSLVLTIPAVSIFGLSGVTYATMASCVGGLAFMSWRLWILIRSHFA